MYSPSAPASVQKASRGNSISQSRELFAARQPTDMPRKQAMSTMFVKNCRNTTYTLNQRMQVSSQNSTRKPVMNR